MADEKRQDPMSKRNLIKTQKEILKIKKACELGDKVLANVLKNISAGITEQELRREIIRMIRKNGAKLSFKPIIAFGKNASEVHHKPNNTRLNKKHGFVMIDMGTKVQGYCSDMTRTVFMGRANKKQRKIYQTVLNAQKKSIKLIKKYYDNTYHHSDLGTKEIDRVVRNYIIEHGYPTIPHSVGHGIGKRVHESFRLGPKSKTILKNGMAFTIEPGIYIKGYGGVRIEDVFYLNKGKLIQLTKSPKNLVEL